MFRAMKILINSRDMEKMPPYINVIFLAIAIIMGRPEPLGEPVPPEKREFYEDAFRQQESA